MLLLANIEARDKTIKPLDRTTCRITLEDNGKSPCYELDAGWRRDGTVAWVGIPRRMDEDLRAYEPQVDWGPAQGAVYNPTIWILERLLCDFLTGAPLTLPMRIDNIRQAPLTMVMDD